VIETRFCVTMISHLRRLSIGHPEGEEGQTANRLTAVVAVDTSLPSLGKLEPSLFEAAERASKVAGLACRPKVVLQKTNSAVSRRLMRRERGTENTVSTDVSLQGLMEPCNGILAGEEYDGPSKARFTHVNNKGIRQSPRDVAHKSRLLIGGEVVGARVIHSAPNGPTTATLSDRLKYARRVDCMICDNEASDPQLELNWEIVTTGCRPLL